MYVSKFWAMILIPAVFALPGNYPGPPLHGRHTKRIVSPVFGPLAESLSYVASYAIYATAATGGLALASRKKDRLEHCLQETKVSVHLTIVTICSGVRLRN